MVWDDPAAGLNRNSDDRKISSLIVEYFKSELATHSGLKITLPSTAADAVQKAKFVRGKALSAEQVKALCKNSDSGIFCAVSLKTAKSDTVKKAGKNGKKISDKSAVAVIYDANGKVLGKAHVPYSDVKKVDSVCEKLAAKAAEIIRKNDPAVGNDSSLKSIIIPQLSKTDDGAETGKEKTAQN